MKLMRINAGAVVEIVEVPDIVTVMTVPAIEAVFDTATGAETSPVQPAEYAERPAIPSDFFHPDAGFVPAEAGVVVGMVLSGEGWVMPEPPTVEPPPPIMDIHKSWLCGALAEAGKLDAVNAAAAKAGPVDAALWANATNIRRDDPSVIKIAAALKLDLPALFARADAIRKERQGVGA